jgi:hypothetical protein
MQWTYKTLCISWVAWCNSSLVVFAQIMVFAIAQAFKFKSYFWKTKKNLFNILWLTGVRFEKPRVFLLKSSWTCSTIVELLSWTKLQLSWAFSTTVEFFSWAELQLSWAFSTTVELSQLQLNFNFRCEPLWPYTSWTCLRAVDLGFSLLNSLVKTSWTGFKGQFNWSLIPLTSDQQSASQTSKQVARDVRGDSTGLVQPGQTAGQSASQSDSQTGRQSAWHARGGSTALEGGSTGFRRGPGSNG